jgi:hypothetical protein
MSIPYRTQGKQKRLTNTYFPEDGSCYFGRNFGQVLIFDATYTRKPKIYIELRPRKPKNKNWMLYFK